MRRFIAITCSASMATAVWVYTWPYGESNACRCVEQKIGQVLSFDNAEDCLKSFASERSEYCIYEGEGLSQHKCANSVSIKEGLFNSDCETMCEQMLTHYITFEEFSESCRLELTADVGGAVVPAAPDSCYTNQVYGYADVDPHNNVQAAPLAVYPDVDTPAACQQLCQLQNGCVFFSWRATCDADYAKAGDYQSEVNTCILYAKDYMDGVLAVDLSNAQSVVLQGNSKYCDVEHLQANCRLNSIIDSNSFFPYGQNRDCLLCGCVHKCAWPSPAHITGPRFCGDETVTACNFPESVVTTTTTPVTCPTETCAENTTDNVGSTSSTPAEGVSTTSTPAESGSSSLTTTTTPANGDTTTGVDLDTTTPSADTTTGVDLDTTTDTTTGVELDTTTSTTPSTDTTTGVELDTTTTPTPETTTGVDVDTTTPPARRTTTKEPENGSDLTTAVPSSTVNPPPTMPPTQVTQATRPAGENPTCAECLAECDDDGDCDDCDEYC